MGNYLFVVNPVSGSRNKGPLLHAIAQHALKRRINYAVYFTTGSDADGQQIREQAALHTPERIVVCGGDGTFNLVAGAMVGSNIPLGLIPAGSANGLATELRIPGEMDEAVELCFSGKAIEIDVIRLNGVHYSFHMSDLGFNARMIAEFEKLGERGMMAYAKAFFLSLKDRPTARYKINANGLTITTHAEMVVIANAARYGTGAVVSPHSKINDGTFEIVIFKPIPVGELVNLTLAAFLGSLENSPYVEIIKTTYATIETEIPQYFQVDGQILEKTNRVEAGISREVVSVIVPDDQIFGA